MSEITTLHLTQEEAEWLNRLLNSAWMMANENAINLPSDGCAEYAEQCLRFMEALP